MMKVSTTRDPIARRSFKIAGTKLLASKRRQWGEGQPTHNNEENENGRESERSEVSELG